MKFPESWLREHVTIAASRDELAARLTAIGLEVEAVETFGSALDGVVVAEILSTAKHPEADRLQVCQVSIGGAEPVQIVCGAPNARAGLKAPLAIVGACLPGGVAIKAAKLRGVDSFGMLCSAKELALDPDASGLLELPADAPVGAPLAHLLGLPDASFELKLTPNRADCFSVRGVAFDVAAALGTQVNALEIPEVDVLSSSRMEVVLNAGADCPRYCGRVIEGLDPAAKSPLWLTEKLKRAGLRPLSPLVDVTNFVMLELGQPMHAFDADTLRGPIGVRHAKTGEALTLLDGREAALAHDFLLVTDADTPIALAGVMGGLRTRVTESTTRVFLESAHFAPSAIIGRGRKLGLHTDSSHRFERGVDPELPRYALERATALILEIMGGSAGPITEATLPEHISNAASVLLRRARIARVLGVAVADEQVERILRALGMQVVREDAEAWRVVPPSRRFDIAIEEDLIEEIARIHGYEAIPVRMPAGEVRLAAPSETTVSDAVLRRQLAADDYVETINYAFIDASTLQTWGLDAEAVALANPLSTELGAMRTSLLPGLVAALSANRSRQQNRVRLFELGRVFHRRVEAAPLETQRIAAVVTGSADAEQWASPAREFDFYDLKSSVERLFALVGARAEFRVADEAFGHPGRSASVWRDGKRVGWLGHLHPKLTKALDLDGEVLGFELDLQAVTDRSVSRAAEISRYPSVRRDLAVVVPESMPWASLAASLKAALGGLLREAVLFDRYVGSGLQAGMKSLAVGLILQDVSRTLTDVDADRAVNAALAALARDCGAKLRD